MRFYFLRPTFMWHFYNGFVVDVTVHAWSLSADGWRRWKIRVLLANMYHHVADFFFSESLYCIEMVLFHHAVSTKHSMRCPVENTQDVICPRESMCVPALRRWGHMGRSNSAQITGCNITQPLNWLQVSRCLQRVAVMNHVSEQEVLSCSAQFSS